MKKILIAFVLLALPLAAQATVAGIQQGGTATTSAPSGQVLYGAGLKGYQSVATSSAGVTAPITFSGTLGGLVGGTGGSFGCTSASAGVTGCLTGTDWSTFNNKLSSAITALGPTGQTQSGAAQTLASSTAAFNGLTFGVQIVGNSNTQTFTPTISGTLSNAGLANSTISGIALGQSLNAHTHDSTLSGTSYNGSASVSDWGLNLGHGNSWTALQTFANSTTTAGSFTYASSTAAFFGTLNLPLLTGTQCLHEISGVVSGTGADCGAGTGSGLATTSPVAGGNLLEYSASGAGSAFGIATGTISNGTNITVTGGSAASVVGGNITINLSGTVGLANGGTATTTFLNGPLVFSDGNKLTQPAALSSLFWDNTNNRLGIGTSSPYAKLSVAGTVVGQNFVATSTTATSTFAGDVVIGANSSVSPNPYLFIGTSTVNVPLYGRVQGDLVDAEYDWNGQSSINVANANIGNCASATFFADGNNPTLGGYYGTFSFLNDGWTGSGCAIGAGTAQKPEAVVLANPTGEMDFVIASTTNTGSADFNWFRNTNTPLMKLTNGGNLGIGSTSPYAQLSVFAGGDYSSHAASTLFAVGSSTAGTATSTLFSILSSGNVGVGTTSPYAAFSIGTGSNVGVGFTAATTTFSTTGGINLKSGCFAVNNTCVGNVSGSNFFTNSGASTYLSTGTNLGIGSTSPTYPLSLGDNSTIGGTLGLTLREDGDSFGAVALKLQNRNGVNGALFQQLGAFDLVDFVFQGLSNQRNIRYENRSNGSYELGQPEFEIGTPSDPTMDIADTGVAIRKGGLSIGSTIVTPPTNGLYVSGIAGFGTTTPAANFTVANGAATTTLDFGSRTTTKGTCIKLYRTDGTAIYAYVAAGATAFTLTTTACATVSDF